MSGRNPRLSPWRPPSRRRQCKGRNNFPELRHINRLSYEYPKNCSFPPHKPPLCCPCLFRNGGSNVSRREEYVFGRHKPWRTVSRRHIPPGKRQDRITNERGKKRNIADDHRLSLVWEENNYRLQALRAKHPPRQRPLCQPWRHVTVAGVAELGVSSTSQIDVEGVLRETAIQAKSLLRGVCRKGWDTGNRDSGCREWRLRCAGIGDL